MTNNLLKKLNRLTSLSLVVALLAVPFAFLPIEKANAVNPNIRQEINIIDAVITATSTGAIVQLDTTQYTAPTYYFEVVAKVTSGTGQVSLTRYIQSNGVATTTDKTIAVTATSYTRVRSTSFSPVAGQTNYVVGVSGGVGTTVIAARIIILDTSTTITATETQIEIGAEATGLTATSTTALISPKYWKYNSANWDTSTIFYGEASYKSTSGSTTVVLQEDNGSFASWDDIALIVNQGTATSTGTRGRSSSFTPTNGLNYRLAAKGADVPQFISVGSIAEDLTGACAITPTPPTHLVGDILVASLWNEGGSKPVTATVGWSEIATVAGTADATWYWLRATTTTTVGPAVTAADTDCFGTVYVIRGAITTGTPYEDATTSGDGGTSTTTPRTATITTTGINRLAIGFLNHGDDIAFASGFPPATWTSTSSVSTGGGTDAGFQTIAKGVYTAGDVPAVAFGTWSVAEAFSAVTLAFIPGTYDIYNGKIVAQTGFRENVLNDSYSETNQNATAIICSDCQPNINGTVYNPGITIGQSFTSIGGILDSAKFYLSKTTSPTGNFNARLYAHSGVFGSTSISTGGVLATSDNVDVTTLGTSLGLITFSFTGANQYQMVNGTNYVIDVTYSNTAIATGFVNVGYDDTSPTHSGNLCVGQASTVCTNARPLSDTIFYLYSDLITPVSLFEPQYLLLNKASTATGLQDYDTIYETDEWTGVCTTFYHAQDAIGASANSKLQNTTGPVDVTNSSVTGANQQISSALTMPADGTTIDTNIVNAGTEVDASRIIVAVNTDASTCAGAVQSYIIRILNGGVRIKDGSLIIKAR